MPSAPLRRRSSTAPDSSVSDAAATTSMLTDAESSDAKTDPALGNDSVFTPFAHGLRLWMSKSDTDKHQSMTTLTGEARAQQPWLPVTVEQNGKRVFARRKSFIQARSKTDTSSPPPSPTRKLRHAFGVGDDGEEDSVQYISMWPRETGHDRQLSDDDLPLINPFKSLSGSVVVPPPPCLFPLSPPATVLNTPQLTQQNEQNSLLRRAPSLSRLLARKSSMTSNDATKSFANSLRRRSTTALFKLGSSKHGHSSSTAFPNGPVSPSSSLIPPLCATAFPSMVQTDLYRSQSDSRTAVKDRDAAGPMWQRELGVLSEGFGTLDLHKTHYEAYATGLKMLMVTNPDEPDDLTDTVIGKAL
ncbi:hypothetical protein OIV83_005957 [Microbotryomycetes sp. JL201]|nr:hypothetical protein OIV83_005957 [Microbotryomycetes sp. JL201]